MSPSHQLSLIRAVFGRRGSNQNTRRCSSLTKLSCHWSVCLGPARLWGKTKTVRGSECRVTFNYDFTGGPLISRCPFQGCRREVLTSPPSSGSLGQVLTWFFKKFDQTQSLSLKQNTPGLIQPPPQRPPAYTHTCTRVPEWKFKLTVNISNKYISPSFCF